MTSATSGLLEITFQQGSFKEISRVAAFIQRDGEFVVMTERTPFHPRDFQRPDQPEDTGCIQTAEGAGCSVADAVFVGISPSGEFSVDFEIPVKKDNPDWRFCVGHIIRGERPRFERGEEILLHVDEERRSALSRAHSAAHIMALALDRSLAPLWRKEVRSDALGCPDFDGLAMEVSAIGLLSCHDRYRIGRSLRKKGFSGDAMRQHLKKHEDDVNATIAGWLASDAPISIRAEGKDLTSRRYFCTSIEGKSVEMPCGGTHARSFAEIGLVSVTLAMPDEETLVAETSVI